MVTSRKPSKRPSMFEVAKLAGVSHQTVSRVINDSPDVPTPPVRESRPPLTNSLPPLQLRARTGFPPFAHHS